LDCGDLVSALGGARLAECGPEVSAALEGKFGKAI